MEYIMFKNTRKLSSYIKSDILDYFNDGFILNSLSLIFLMFFILPFILIFLFICIIFDIYHFFTGMVWRKECEYPWIKEYSNKYEMIMIQVSKRFDFIHYFISVTNPDADLELPEKSLTDLVERYVYDLDIKYLPDNISYTCDGSVIIEYYKEYSYMYIEFYNDRDILMVESSKNDYNDFKSENIELQDVIKYIKEYNNK